jgi:hypothetical protein
MKLKGGRKLLPARPVELEKEIGLSGLRALSWNKVSRNNVFSSFFLLLSGNVTFLPEGVNVGFRNFAWAFNSQKKKISGTFRGPPCPLGVDF